MLAEKFLQQERFAGASQSCDYLDESVAFGTAQLVNIPVSVDYLALPIYVTCDTFWKTKLYILSLIREIHQEKTRTEAVASAPN